MNGRTENMHVSHEKLLSNSLRWALLTLLFFSLLINGCGLKSPAPPVPYPGPASIPQPLPSAPAPYSPKPGPASALYRQAETSLTAGRYQQAELELERALRIEPRNPDYWYAMARVKYKQNRYQQAVQFCLKSKSLAGRNSELIRLNDTLISEARQHQAN